MNQFKITIPAGYNVDNIYNDNIDINIVFENGDVFFGTLFTLSNIHNLMIKDLNDFFWCPDMFIVKDLSYLTIKRAIESTINDDTFKLIFSKIGTIRSVYDSSITFDCIIEMESVKW